MTQKLNTCTTQRNLDIFLSWRGTAKSSKFTMLKLANGFRMFQVISYFKLYFIEKNAGAGGAVIAADYVEYGNIKFVATTSNNNSINFWDSNNYIFRERLNTSDIQMTCI